MCECGIDRAVVFKSEGIENQELLSLIRGDHRFYFFWWAKVDDEFSDYEVEICGIKIHPTIEKRRVDQFQTHLKFACDKKIPVIVHCGRYNPIASYRYALEVGKRYRLKLILAHMGGANPEIALDAIGSAEPYSNIHFGIEGIVEPWLLKQGIKLLGPERFIFGSDFPISHPRIYLDLVEIVTTESEQALILGQNLLRLINE